MKAVTLISILVSAMALNSCCCQAQKVPPLRPMPRNLISDVPPPNLDEPVKVIAEKEGK